jgi:hypothetical protein
MAGDRFLAELLGQTEGDPLGQPAGVDEHQRAAVGLDQSRQPVIHLAPMLVRANGGQLLHRQFQTQVEIAGVADVDDDGRRFRVQGSGFRRAGFWILDFRFWTGGVRACFGVLTTEYRVLSRVLKFLCNGPPDLCFLTPDS